jgi:hypothetical protein
MFRIVGDRRVTGRAIGSTTATVNGEAGQDPVAPGNSTIQSGRPTYIVTATAGDAGDLKCGNNHRSLRKSAGFHFSQVLSARIGEAVLTELSKNALGGSWQGACKADGQSQSRGKDYPAEARRGKRIQRFHLEISSFFVANSD